eukprot:gene11303-13355_t
MALGVRQWKERIAVEKEMKLYINDQAVFNRAFHNVGPYTPLQVPEQADPPPPRRCLLCNCRTVHGPGASHPNPRNRLASPEGEWAGWKYLFRLCDNHRKKEWRPAVQEALEWMDARAWSRELCSAQNDQFYAGNYLVINGDMMEGFNASDVALHAWEPVEPSAFATSRDPTGTGDGGVSLHLQADALQRRRLQDAFALAHLLGRTLVLPTLKCHCDRYWYACTPGTKCHYNRYWFSRTPGFSAIAVDTASSSAAAESTTTTCGQQGPPAGSNPNNDNNTNNKNAAAACGGGDIRDKDACGMCYETEQFVYGSRCLLCNCRTVHGPGASHLVYARAAGFVWSHRLTQ